MRFLVTVPHAFCANHAAVLDHACDTVAAHAARGIAYHLGRLGNQVAEIHGDQPRRAVRPKASDPTPVDLNRPEVVHTPFYKRCRASFQPGDGHIDVHSYPGSGMTHPKWSGWSQHELVICAYPANKQESIALAQWLQNQGVRVLVDGRHGDYFMVQHFAGLGSRPAIMVEFDEEAGLTRIDELSKLVAQGVSLLGEGGRTAGLFPIRVGLKVK